MSGLGYLLDYGDFIGHTAVDIQIILFRLKEIVNHVPIEFVVKNDKLVNVARNEI